MGLPRVRWEPAGSGGRRARVSTRHAHRTRSHHLRRSRISAGPRDVPLLEQTIGEGLRRTVERFGDREALVVRDQGYRATYRELWDEVGLAARGLLARGVRTGDRVGHLGAQPLRVGRHPVRHRAHRRDPRDHQPGLQGGRAQYALTKTGVSVLVLARGFRQADYVAMLDEVRAALPAAARDARPRGRLGGPARRRRARGRGRPGRGRGDAASRRPDQRPVHLGHDRRPQGRHALAPQHPQQRLLHRPDAALHRARPRLRAGALLPLLRHGARQPRLRHPRRLRRRPGRELRPAGHAAGRRGGALHLAVRRADDVHRRARAPALRRARPLQPAHRDHGRRAVPRGGDERRSARRCTWTRSRSAAA